MPSLSVVIPSNRTSLATEARILQACSWAGDAVEVVVRDNSGDAGKRRLLAAIDRPNCRLIAAEPCDADTNFRGALDASSGDFVVFLGDDDAAFDRGVAAMAAMAGQAFADPSIVGLTGAYALEETRVSHIVSYTGVDAADVVQRIDGFLGYQGPNLLFYSAVRRQLLVDAFDFMARHPAVMPFNDNLFTLIYLLGGRFLHAGRLAFIYDNTNWDAAQTGVASDLRYYAAAGLNDPIIRQIHWLLCGFEGAMLAMRSRFGAGASPAQRQAVAAKWFELMFRRFAGDRRQSFGSALAAPAQAIVDRMLAGFPRFDLDAMLADICAYIALFAPEKAEAYGRFWREVAAESGL